MRKPERRTGPLRRELGERLQNYEVWGVIGEGGMSRVWLARHQLLAIPVIVKTVHAEYASDTAGRARVVEEAKLMAKISSPRVVRALDAGVHDHHPFLVEQYVDGVDMAELDRRRRRALGVGFPLWFVCEVMQAACEALYSAHRTGVVHRDMKPSNLFGCPQTGIRLGDFGIAALARESEGASEITGTARFMAPEQFEGTGPSPACDVWGAGATAFDLRYGRVPFSTLAAVLDKDAGPEMPPPASPAEAYFQHVLRGMLAKDPADRPRDIQEPLQHFSTLGRLLRAPVHHHGVVALDRTTYRVHGCTVRFTQGDLVESRADAIVSSASDTMTMRSGVGQALRVAGGDTIEHEAKAHGRQPLGSCVATRAGRLSARHVLHAVSAWREASCVGRATQRALLLADELGHRSLAFAALGTGAAKVSVETCASAMMTALVQHLALGGTHLRDVEIVMLDPRSFETYREVAAGVLHGQVDLSIRDVGLPAAERQVTGDGATWVDVRGRGNGSTDPD
ncbi:MAG: serine/threonine-protein kinase [Polyangiaceae bacterium]